MSDDRALALLAPAAAIFGAIVRARRAAYRHGWLRATHVGRPVISVGNLTVGGNGKTPFTMLLAERLRARGHVVAILSRGYRSRAEVSGDVVVVSRGEGALASAEDAGDEPVLMATKTKALVVVARDRRRAAATAIELGADVLVLDDGLQHLRVARALDVVLLDAIAPLGAGHLLPRGRLREP
ncbi:tetraacyldisaccharide 4'-kinase, partial [Myxococcota bacterium]|nr:tetraacyldisaccharide 4'-kinase [Myxococcota bacterium]